VNIKVITMHIVVWNPWVEKAAAMSDFGNNEVIKCHYCIVV